MRPLLITATAIAAALLAGCQPRWATILDRVGCGPPCWRGIVPGQTSVEDTIEILANTAAVAPSSVKTVAPWGVFSHRVVFDLRSGVSAEASFLDGRAGVISFNDRLGLTFEQATAVLGQPELVQTDMTLCSPPIPLPGDAVCTLVVALTPSAGFRIHALIPGDPSQTELGPNTTIESIAFWTPSDFQTLIAARELAILHDPSQDPLELMHQWSGYGKVWELYPPIPPTETE